MKILILILILLFSSCTLLNTPRYTKNTAYVTQNTEDKYRIDVNFYNTEVSCRCGCGLMPRKEALHSLFALRHLYGDGIIITSGARCNDHNNKVGGKNESRHTLKGDNSGLDAFDVQITDISKITFFYWACYTSGFTTVVPINARKGIFHIDKREKPNYWFYN